MPKYDKYGKNLGGRPRLYTDRDEFEAHVDNYFYVCDHTTLYKSVVQKGEIIKVPTPKPYTMAGLARALRMSRDTLNQYSKSDTFSDIVSQARMRIHEQNIELALIGCHDSKIAALNLASNFGYVINTGLKELAESVSDILKRVHGPTRPALPANPLEIDNKD